MSRTHKRLILTIFAFIFAVITYFNNQAVQQPTQTTSQAEQPPITSPLPATTSAQQKVLVTRVIDGDTIEIEGGQKLRYIGIDTPENTIQKECFGVEASDRNKELVAGKTVVLEKDVSETDRYGRLLRYVYLDGVMVNETLVKEGFAQARSYPPDIKNQEIFQLAEQQALSELRGMWEACATVNN